jgi:Flp pilus assembly protein TadD
VRSAFKHGSLSRRNEVKAAIYSNLAVAKAMNGDLTGAQTDLGKALALNARDKNAVQNKGYITNEKLVSS